jgi:hypothetical protein
MLKFKEFNGRVYPKSYEKHVLDDVEKFCIGKTVKFVSHASFRFGYDHYLSILVTYDDSHKSPTILDSPALNLGHIFE